MAALTEHNTATEMLHRPIKSCTLSCYMSNKADIFFYESLPM